LAADEFRKRREMFFHTGNGHGSITRGRNVRAQHMYYLYGSRHGTPKRLVATFDSEAQLLAYVHWATLFEHDGLRQFEKGSSLAGYHGYSYAGEPLTNDDAATVDHNPSPSML
jgi:hypothetical protein